MLLPLSESYSAGDSSSSHIHSFVPPDLTGQITKLDNQYCAAGSFGDVYRCQYHCEFGVKEVAVKTLRFEFTVEEEDTDARSNRMRRRELGIWKRLNHPNIVPFLGTVSGFGRLGNTSLVSLWMPNGTLQDFLIKYDDKLTVAHRLQFLLDIANGLQHLHSLSIVHGDLTCNNVLLDEKCSARLTDFGYASLVGELPEALAYLQASTLRPGAVRWAAPEYFSSNPEEMFYSTTKSDIYSFGNIALQVLSGELPWSEFRRDAVIVLHLAKGDKPRRPKSHPIDDQHWWFIEHCWSPVQERPSAEHLVLSILHFLESYPPSGPLCGLLVSSEKSNPQSTLNGPSLASPNIDQSSPDIPLEVPRTAQNLHVMAPNQQRGLAPPRTARYSPPPTPDSHSPAPLLLPRKPLPRGDPGVGHGNEVTSTPKRHNQNGSAANPDVSVTDTGFPRRPPPVHSKSGAAYSPFLNTSIGQDQPNIPFLYQSFHQHSVLDQPQETATFSCGDRGAASGSRDGGSGIWSFLSSRLSPPARKSLSTPPLHPSPSRSSNTNVPQIVPYVIPADLKLDDSSAVDHDGVGSGGGRPDPPNFDGTTNSGPLRSVHSLRPVRDYSHTLSGSHGSGDGTRSALSSNRPSPYPSLLASVRYESQTLPMPRPSPPQPNNSSLITVSSERPAGESHRRRKQDVNFLCPVPGCGSTFTRSFDLKGHMRSHNEERRFQCKWPGCGKGFARQHDCKRHEQLNFSYRPFTCEGCNKMFARVDALNRHLLSEGGAECQRISVAAKDLERLPVAKTEAEEGLATSVMA